MAIESAKEFFAVLEKSKLLDDQQLADAREVTADCDNPTEIVRALVRKGVVTRWQAGQLLAGRSTFFLGKYKLIELLGRGGMGNVFLGQHTTMNRRVALKIISRRIGKDKASLERFFAEARAIAGLDHPNIVQAYSVDNEGDRHYIVMEFIDGRDLSQVVEEDGPLDFSQAADYIQQAADGLAHAHDRNMIHCDIKPSNLLVNDQGVVKILDMGLARLGGGENGMGNGSEDQSDAHILGSVDYLAPEQALKAEDFDHRADLYSLGCTLYFLLTGKPPFDKGLLHERLMKHQTQEPPSILEERPDTPAELADLCRRMMAKKADERPQSAAEISEALAKWRSPLLTAKPAAPRVRSASDADDSPVSALPSINIDVQPKTKPTPAVAAIGKKKETTGSKGFLATKQQKLIAAAVGVVAIVVLLAVTITLIVASRPDPSDKSQARTEQPGVTDGSDEPIKKPPADGAPGDLDRSAAVATVSVEAPDSDTQPGKAGDPETEQPKEPEPDEPPVGEPAPDPAAEPSEDPAPDETAKPEEPTDVPSETLEPEEPDQPKPDPDPPKPDPPKPTDPFRELVGAVSLPVVGPGGSQPANMAPVSLGKLDVEEGRPVDVELIGGDNAIKGSRLFTLHRDPNATDWIIRLDSPTRSGDPPPGIEVARVRLDGQAMTFEFLESEELDRANHLRNCALRVSVDGKPHTISLGTAQPAEPLVVNLDTGTARTTVPADWLPETESLRLQITELEGPFSKHTFEQTDTVEMKNKAVVVLTDEKLPTVKLATFFDVKSRSIRVELAAMFQFGEEASRPLRARDVTQMTNQGLAQQQQLEFGLKAIKDKQQREFVESQIAAIGPVVEKLQNLMHFNQAINNTGKVHFRIFSIVDDQEIDLFRTKTP